MNRSGSQLYVTLSRIINDDADYGAGIYNRASGSSVEIKLSKIAGNDARLNGGGIENSAALTIYRSKLLNNDAGADSTGGSGGGPNNVVVSGSPDATVSRSLFKGTAHFAHRRAATAVVSTTE